MLDRTIPYYNLILRADSFSAESFSLPQGYFISAYQDGFDKAWAALEYAIGDFTSENEALSYFKEKYLTQKAKLKSRSVFLCAPDGNVIGSCIAWEDKKGENLVSSLHWLIVAPAYQGKGFGRIILNETMKLFESYPVYIHTQPWSCNAIMLYISAGFKLCRTDTFAGYENQYDDGVKTLKNILFRNQYEKIIRNTEV